MEWGLTSTQRDAALYAAQTAGRAVKSAGAASTIASGGTVAGQAAVASLLTAAGASSAVPFAGWIAAGAALTAAGMIQLVTALKKRRVQKDEAIRMAKEIGFSDAAAIPGFTLRALEWSSAKRSRVAARLEKRVARRAKRDRGWRSWKDTLKLQLIGVIEGVVQAEQRQLKRVAAQRGPQAALQLQREQRQEITDAKWELNRDRYALVGLLGVSALAVAWIVRSQA